MHGGKFAFKNRLGQPSSWKEIYRFSLFYFVFDGNFQAQAPLGAYIWRGDLTEGFLRYEFGGAYIWRGLYMEGLIFGILRYLKARFTELEAGTLATCELCLFVW